jgi:putative peptidoglycan lipid II flippase
MTATQINTLADDLIAWWFSASVEKGSHFVFLGHTIMYPLQRGSVSHLYYSQRLYQLPLGIFGISLATAIFPMMSLLSAKKDFTALAETISKGIRSSLFIAIPATIGLAAIARPLISLAFEHGQFGAKDTALVVWTLLFYSLGLCGYFTQQVVTRAFYSMQDSRTPMLSALTAVIANIILNLTFIWFLGTAGLAAATAACSYLQIIVLVAVLRRRLGRSVLEGLTALLLKTASAAICMSAAIVGTIWLSRQWPDIFKLLLLVPAAAAVFLTAAKLLHIDELELLTKRKTES